MPRNPTARLRRAVEAVIDVVGARGVVDNDAAEGLLTDHLGRYRGTPALVVRPDSTAQVSAVLSICNDAGVGVVPQGGNTGYCGGATPDASGHQVLLSLARMKAVREVDADNFTMTVEAGVPLASVHEAAAAAGLQFPLTLGSQGSCQIGGNLATNAGGTAVLRYGNARDLVLGLEVVLADGTVVDSLTAVRKDNAGYDLRQLFIGSEGTLGVITAAVLKLYPQPVVRETALVAVPGPTAAVRLLARARRDSGDTVTSFELLPRLAVDLVIAGMDGTSDPMDQAYPWYVLMELSSSARLPLDEILMSMVGDALRNGDATDAVVATSGVQRDALWRLREAVPEAQKRVGGSFKHDISVPTSRIASFMADTAAALADIAPAARLCTYGHLGDGNLHYNLLPPEGQSLAEFADRDGAAISAAVYERVRRLGGSVAAEHGIGQAKAQLLADSRDPAVLALMTRLKSALDPRGILNPGKVLRRTTK